jgi:hypothetical protein
MASAKASSRAPCSTPLVVAAASSVRAARLIAVPLCSLLARSRYECALVQ